MLVYTLGHSSRSLQEVVGLLNEAGIKTVWDVRRFPRSRTNPQFNAESLAAALAAAGIDYRHFEALGGRRRPLPEGASPNGLWNDPGFRGFADYALELEFRLSMQELQREAERTRLLILCSEAVWWRCHRRIVADYLLVAGQEVVHILGRGRTEPARLTPSAEPQLDGAIHYPARPKKQP